MAKMTATDLAIKHINDKIDTLNAAKQHILDAHEAIGAPTEDAAPKARKTRKRKGLPAAEGL